MCGVSGFFGKKKINFDVIKKTLYLMKKRGPDSQNYFHRKTNNLNIYLLHSRLEIIDPKSRSNQPFKFKNLIMIFNGEIYNYKELRNTLSSKYSFETNSDTEVLLKMYYEYGDKCFEYLEGMWAIAIYDLNKNRLLLSRDRFGEKPLHYLLKNEGIFFGSEIKFLKQIYGNKLNLNYDILKNYISEGYKGLDLNINSYYKEVQSVKPGEIIYIKSNLHLARKIFWKPKFNPNYKIKKKEVMEGAKHYLEKSLKIRLRSDKKIGFMLSGGVDSSYLASLAQKKFNQEIETYSIISDDIKYNEKKNIKEIIKNLRCKSYFVKPKTNFFFDLKTLIKYHEAPISTISYLIHSYLPKKMKSNNIRVAISGTGADEIFSGYYHHFQLFLKTIKNKKIFKKNLSSWRKYIRPLLRNENLKDESIIFNNAIKKNPFKLIKTSYKYSKDILRNKMMNEMFHEVVPVILKHDDNNCMMQSIENRSPYLDKDLFEFMNTVPTEYLIENGYQKNILRSISKKILLKNIRLDRKKVGFNASIEEMINVRDKKFTC